MKVNWFDGLVLLFTWLSEYIQLVVNWPLPSCASVLLSSWSFTNSGCINSVCADLRKPARQEYSTQAQLQLVMWQSNHLCRFSVP